MLRQLYYHLLTAVGFLVRRTFRPNKTTKIVSKTIAFINASGTVLKAIDMVATHETVSLVSSSNFSSINDWPLPNQLCVHVSGLLIQVGYCNA